MAALKYSYLELENASNGTVAGESTGARWAWTCISVVLWAVRVVGVVRAVGRRGAWACIGSP